MNHGAELYPVWLRVWHWLNVTLFLALIVTGFSLHVTEWGVISFATARVVHNVAGLLLIANYLYYLVGNLVSGNFRHYWPRWRALPTGVMVMMRHYGLGIFQGHPLPHVPTIRCKFNPMQQVTYLMVMAVGMPLLMASGVLLFFPDLLPARFLGMDGVWPVAVFHYLMGLFLLLFMLGHVYLGTAGETPTAEFHKMIQGERLHGEEHP